MSANHNTNIQLTDTVVTQRNLHKFILCGMTVAIAVGLIFLDDYWRLLVPESLSLSLLGVTVVVFFLSGAVKGIAGIGMGLVAVPVMSIMFEPVLAVCVVAVPLVITNFWQGVVRADSARAFNKYRTLFTSMTLAMICTGYFSSYFSVAVTSIALGSMAVVFSLLNLGFRLPRFSDTYDNQLQFVCGAMAGIVGGITGLVVIPLVLYMLCRDVSKNEFVSSLGLLLLISGLVLILCYGLNGAMTVELFMLSALASVPALFGVIVGESIRQLLDDQLFRRIVLYMIMAIGMKILLDVSW